MSGRGTAGGVVFQAEIGAAVAGLILAERDLARLGSDLPGRPQRVLFETPTAVDDVLIETDVGEVTFKRSVPFRYRRKMIVNSRLWRTSSFVSFEMALRRTARDETSTPRAIDSFSR